MSCTTIAVAYADGNLRSEQDFRNAWGSAVFIWNTLARKYKIGANEDGTWGKHYKSNMPDYDAWGAVWEYHQAGKPLRPWEANTLVTTYDRMVITREQIPVIAASLRRFVDAHLVGTQVCTLLAQADFLDGAYAAGAVAVAWNQTSVSETWYWERIPDSDDYQGYNVLTGTNHNTADVLPL